MMLKTFLREPLLHFLLIAVLIFWYLDNTEQQDGTEVIYLDNSKVLSAQNKWQDTLGRALTNDEQSKVTDSLVRDEMFYHEGIRLGLDKNDSVVRNRVIQKLQFMQEFQTPEPSMDQLQSWLNAHPEKYPPRITLSFEHVFLGQVPLNIDMAQLLNAINTGKQSPTSFAQPLLAPSKMTGASITAIATQFGPTFANALLQANTIPLNTWQGPIQSGFGSHLFSINERRERAFSLDDANDLQTISNDWLTHHQDAAIEGYITRLQSRYNVVIDTQ